MIPESKYFMRNKLAIFELKKSKSMVRKEIFLKKQQFLTKTAFLDFKNPTIIIVQFRYLNCMIIKYRCYDKKLIANEKFLMF